MGSAFGGLFFTTRTWYYKFYSSNAAIASPEDILNTLMY